MFKCYICQYPCDSLPLLRRHVTCKHLATNLGRFVCKQGSPECVRVFSNSKSLYKHMQRDHKNHNFRQEEKEGTNILVCDDVVNAGNDVENNSEETAVYEETSMKYDSSEISYFLNLLNNCNVSRGDVDNIIFSSKLLFNSKLGEESDAFRDLDTEYKRIKALVDLNLWTRTKSIVLEHHNRLRKDEAKQKFSSQHVSAEMISLKSTLEKFFGVAHVLQTAVGYMAEKQNEVLTDVKDGIQLQDLPKNTFPYVLFFDELELNNPLGSKKGIHKLGFLYATMRCFPPHMYSDLYHIFLYMIIPHVNRTKWDEALSFVVNEMKDLFVKGIELNNVQYRFRFVGLSGDNLAQNQILGFAESFVANYFCRACQAHRTQCYAMCAENINLLRNTLNYNSDLAKEDVSSTGIKRRCIFNDVPCYDVTQNLLFDPMHDLLEGVCNYDMVLVITHLVEENIITLDAINEALKRFPFRNSRPPPITPKKLRNRDLSYSASEMLSLVNYFAVIVGLSVPEDLPVWNLYLNLQNIVSLILRKTVSRDLVDYLNVLITEHNEMFIELSRSNLKPKMHNLLHYKTCLLRFGPMCHNWAMRFEGKNYIYKMLGQIIKSRVNVCKSLAIRHNYLFAGYLFQLKNQSSFLVLQETSKVFNCDDVCQPYFKWVKRKGITYEIGSLVKINCNIFEAYSDASLYPNFGLIKYLNPLKNDVSFILDVMDTIDYCSHLNCFNAIRKSRQFCLCTDPESVSQPLKYVIKKDIFLISNLF